MLEPYGIYVSVGASALATVCIAYIRIALLSLAPFLAAPRAAIAPLVSQREHRRPKHQRALQPGLSQWQRSCLRSIGKHNPDAVPDFIYEQSIARRS